MHGPSSARSRWITAAVTTVLDHGPVYRRRAFASSDRHHREPAVPTVVGASLDGWLGALDLVVSLEAPDVTLLGRAKERGTGT